MLTPNPEDGGMFDGLGRRVVRFPDDGHPDMCNAVLDLTGDCRDEIVVWDPHELWVYTQDDNPRAGRLYRPRRNPLYNYFELPGHHLVAGLVGRATGRRPKCDQGEMTGMRCELP